MSRITLWSIFALAGVGCLGCGSKPAGSGSTAERGVILLRYSPGSESTQQREEGFLDTMKKDYPDIKILSSDQYAGTTQEEALDRSQQLLNKYRSQLDGVFAVNESCASGMLRALEDAGLAGKVAFVGFDSSPRMVKALEDGKMQGIVLQDPVQMGYLAVKTMAAHLDGQKVEKRVGTGEHAATAENMKDAEVQKLLSPEQFGGAEAKPADSKYTIAVIPKGTTHEFWKSVHAGAEKAAKELGNVTLIWKGPLKENDRDGQISVVQESVTKGVKGICLAPLDAQALVASVKEAKNAGIPTVIFDSGLNDQDAIVSYVATDNHHGGEVAAKRLAEVLKSKAAAAPAKPASN